MDIVSTARGLTVGAIPIIIAITFHEAGHAWVANKLGDPTAKDQGRLTLNPIAHIDPIGTLLIPVLFFISSSGSIMFGYAKPVPVNFNNFRKLRRDSLLVAAAGPAVNILLATVSIFFLMIGYDKSLISDIEPSSSEAIIIPLLKMLNYSISFNILLASFNLLPIPPLDGGRIVNSLLPINLAYKFSRIEPYGFFVVILLWVTGVARPIIMSLQSFIKLLISILLLPFSGLF